MTFPPALAESLRFVRRRWLDVVAILLLGVWCIWWGVALGQGELPFAEHTWITHPAFGVDFWTQTDLAARKWHTGQDPYADRVHLFHYPPIVIRLFAWTPYLEVMSALRIWIVVLALTLCVGTWVAVRARRDLGLGPISLPVAWVLTLYSFPAIFALERSNFDLITLMVILPAWALFRSSSKGGHVVAGALLSVGPWVKIYPGLIGLGLLALRRYGAVMGFVAAGLAIGLAAPEETSKSFEVLALAIEYAKPVVTRADFFPWGHSLSVALWKAVRELDLTLLVPVSVLALAALAPVLGWVCYRVFRAARQFWGDVPAERSAALALPVLLWVTAAASFVPQIANDYSLVFLPLAALVVWTARDPWPMQVGLGLLVLAFQPVALPIPGLVLLGFKLVGLGVIGVAVVRRAREAAEHSNRSEPLAP